MGLQIQIAKLAVKQLAKAPSYIRESFARWFQSLQTMGLHATHAKQGYRDEALKGERLGQRSIRLNQQWRVIYRVSDHNEVQIITVEEVTPHDYRTR
jgi:toxin HigB-1